MNQPLPPARRRSDDDPFDPGSIRPHRRPRARRGRARRPRRGGARHLRHVRPHRGDRAPGRPRRGAAVRARRERARRAALPRSAAARTGASARGSPPSAARCCSTSVASIALSTTTRPWPTSRSSPVSPSAQLTTFLAERGNRHFVSMTGSTLESSVVGNTIERGDGVGPLGDRVAHVCAPRGRAAHRRGRRDRLRSLCRGPHRTHLPLGRRARARRPVHPEQPRHRHAHDRVAHARARRHARLPLRGPRRSAAGRARRGRPDPAPRGHGAVARRDLERLSGALGAHAVPVGAHWRGHPRSIARSSSV
jgi:hypothetical protein